MAPRHPGAVPADRPLVFVDDLESPQLDAGDRHHLEKVLRVRRDAPITIGDGRGRWRAATMATQVATAGPVQLAEPSLPELVVGFVPVKGDRPDWVVQKLTEIGVDRILVLRADRSVVRWDGERGVRHVDRLRRIVREAAMQCRRPTLPGVEGIMAVSELLARPGVALASRGGAPPSLGHPILLVGPEGGWSEAEIAGAPHLVDLGTHMMRAETAAVAAGTLLSALRGGLVTEAREIHPA